MQFQILGPLQVLANNVPLPVRGSREQKILATLLLHADQPVPLEHLVNAVWDDNPPATAATQVRNRISGLRKSWSSAIEQPCSLLTTEGNGYLLRLKGHDLDLRNLEHQVSSAREAAGADNREEAARLLRAALGYWRGPTLYGIGGDAVTAAATLLEERRLLVTEECLSHELALGRHQQLIIEISALVRVHPFRERFTHHLMLALHRSGRQADALACYQRHTRILRDELGLDPSPELKALHEAILRRSPAIDLPARIAVTQPVRSRAAPTQQARSRTATQPAPAAVSPTPADLPDPPATPAQDPGAAAFLPAEVPADVVDFTGRVRELDALDAFLPPGNGPLSGGMSIIAVTGTGGAGKTALAVRWAQKVAMRFPNGQLHVNLQGYSQGPPMQPIEALATMLRAVGVGADNVPVELDEAARLFRSMLADKRMLIVLDNVRSAEQIRPLLPGSSGCLVLVTSRNRLAGLVASHGARRLTVDPLSEDEAVELLGRILGRPRIANEPQAASRLAQACAFLPLALRIAAANLDGEPHRSIAGYVDELHRGDRLAALRIVDDSQAVQSVFDASYAGLSTDTRQVFRLLGLAPGPDIAMAAVPSLTGLGEEQATLVVGRLTAAHLVQPSAPGRFTAHDLLRLYMKQRAETEDSREQRAAAVERLLRWHLDHARAAARVLHPHMLRLADLEHPTPAARFDDHAAAVAWLDAERPNLVAAIDHAAAYGPKSIAWLLADALRGYFWLRGHVVDWLRIGRVACAAAAVSGDLRGQAVAYISLAFAHDSQGRYGRAMDNYRTALELSTAAGWEEGRAAALGNLGLAEASAGNLRQAVDSLEVAAGIDQRLGLPLGLATTMRALGQVKAQLGFPREALRYLQEALASYERAGSASGQAMTLGSLAYVLRILGRFDEAVWCGARALAIHRDTGDQDGEAGALETLARVHHDAGHHRDAMDHAAASLALIDQTDRRRGLAATLNTLGRVCLAAGKTRQAITYHEQAIATTSTSESHYHRVEAEAGLAAALHRLGDEVGALARARRALKLVRQADYRILEGEVLVALADVHVARGSIEEARSCARQASQVFRQVGCHLSAAAANALRRARQPQTPRAAPQSRGQCIVRQASRSAADSAVSAVEARGET